MTNQEIISTGQTIATETHIGGNTAERVGGVIEAIGENLKSIGEHRNLSFDVAAGSSTPTTQRLTVNIPTGMRFYIEVDDSLGDGNLYTLLFRYDGQSSGTEIQRILSGTKYEFVATQGIADIYVWKAAVDTNKTVSINVWTSIVGDTEFLLGISSRQNELLLEGSTDFLQICTKRANYYAAITNGSINSYTGLDLYSATIPNGVKSFRIYIAGKDSGSAAVAFYSSETQNASTFISAVANTAQAQMIEVEIPNGAVSVAFTNYPTTLATPVIRAVGVDYVKAEDFGNSVKVVTQDIFSETYPHVNVLPIADYVSAKWIRKTDGVPVQSSLYLGYYKITIEDWMKKVVVKSYVSDSNPAAIAFYSSDTPSSGTYLSSSSVSSIAGTNYYYSDIPANAVCFCVTHRNDSGDALPIIEVTGQGGVSKGYIDQIVGSKLIASRSAAGVTGNSITETINLSQYENGTHFLLKMIDASGTKNKMLGYLPNANSRTFFLKRVETGGNYYFDKTSEFTSIRLYCASGTNEVMDYELYVVSNSPHNNNVLMQPDTTSLEQNSINLGKPLQGAYWITPTTTQGDSAWVCFQIQYSRGYSIHLNIDFETYYLALKLWYIDLSTFEEVRITAETDYYIPLCIGAWHIQVRRIDRVPVAAETVVNALTCTFVSGSGLKWEKPAPISYMESLLNEAQEQIDKVKEKVTHIQVVNPFFNKPWYAHYSPDGFIKDGSGNNVIASESLADIEMAARLGFSFIEANIQPTSDGHFIVTHGNGGAFGNEVKSADDSVITTADLQATAINTKTLSWIKTYVRYNSTLTKYQTTIPTLEEFCVCCKENNIGIFGGTSQRTAIDTMIKYLGKDAVIVYNPPSNIRDYFNGLIFVWNNSSGTTPETLLANAKYYGAPYMCGIGPTLYAELVSNGLEDFIEDMHKNGFLVGHGYLTEEDAREAFRMGMDFAAAGHDVNPFKGDKVYDLDGNASDFTTTGTIANNVATLSSGQTISCGVSDVLPLAKCSLSVRFTGSLRISFGSAIDYNRTITSDGTELVVITDYCYKRSPALTITATASTTITGLVYKYAIC